VLLQTRKRGFATGRYIGATRTVISRTSLTNGVALRLGRLLRDRRHELRQKHRQEHCATQPGSINDADRQGPGLSATKISS
jgi:hypothetical protein